MVTLQFEPQNEAAKATLARTRPSRHLLATALSKDFPQLFGPFPFEPGPIPAELLVAIRTAAGAPLPALTERCLVIPPEAVAFVRDGRVILYLDAPADQADALAKRLRARLVASSLGQGSWSVETTVDEPSIELSSRMHGFWIPTLDLPIPADTEQDDIEWVEDALADALYAAMISQAAVAEDPFKAIGYLPQRSQIHVANARATRQFRGADGDADLAAYTRVTFEANVAVRGSIFIGEAYGAGSGLLMPQDRGYDSISPTYG